jgi:2-C-methyl-D-erythritol 4-phosphate cytidylyltransferase
MVAMQIAVILPAAGLGTRFVNGGAAGQASSKIEVEVAGKPVFVRAVELFLNRPLVKQVILAVNPERLEDFRFRWGDKLGFMGVQLVPGGDKERWETVLRAIEHVADQTTHIAVHDAARPATSKALIDRVFTAAERFDAIIPGLPVSATLKRVQPLTDSEQAQRDPLDAILGSSAGDEPAVQRVVQTIARDHLVEVQTPQVFEAGLLRQAYEQVAAGKLDAQGVTDDASLVEAMGQTVYAVEGESTNIKITRPADAELVHALLEKREAASKVELAKMRLFADEED